MFTCNPEFHDKCKDQELCEDYHELEFQIQRHNLRVTVAGIRNQQLQEKTHGDAQDVP